MRYPSRSSSNNFSTGTDGYGLPPSVKISHNRTPYDHLHTTDKRRFTEMQFWIKVGAIDAAALGPFVK